MSNRGQTLTIERSARGIDRVTVRVARGQRDEAVEFLRVAMPMIEALDQAARRTADATCGDLVRPVRH